MISVRYILGVIGFLCSLSAGQDLAGCPPCSPSECRVLSPGDTPYTCPNGYEMDECGCELPSCFCEGCPQFTKELRCDLGFQIGETGCPINECMIPIIGAGMTCPPCFESLCGIFAPDQTPYSCPNGFVKDACGCDLPSCQCEGCDPFDTTLFCPSGYRSKRRCPVSRCRPPPPPSAPRCPTVEEPLGPMGRSCATLFDCPAPQICCITVRNGRKCVNGILPNI